MTAPVIQSLDHLVLTVADPEATADFYARVLGLRPVAFGEGRRALAFGAQKINRHRAGAEFEPKAARPAPVGRTGATGPLRSVYIRDPDGNLVEVANRA